MREWLKLDHALEPPGLRRQLGSPALFGIVQGFIAASIYFSVGLVAERALGFTWVVFLAGAVLFAVIVPCYVEGASLHQERGGATVLAERPCRVIIESQPDTRPHGGRRQRALQKATL